MRAWMSASTAARSSLSKRASVAIGLGAAVRTASVAAEATGAPVQPHVTMGAAAGEVKAGPTGASMGRSTLAIRPATGLDGAMRELRRSNDLVYLSFAEAALRSHGLHPHIFDAALSAVEGSISAFPRRLVVPEEEEAAARTLLDQLDAEHAAR
jgi:hypothetical protein